MFSLRVDEELEIALVQPSFAKQYLSLVSEHRDALSEWLVWPEHGKDEAFFQSFITRSLHGYADGKSLTCAMVYHGKVVGSISYNSIDTSLGKVTMGYWCAPSYQGKGIVTRCVKKLIDYAFEHYQVHKVEIHVATGNLPSQAVCQRLGLEQEGVITRAENLNGRIVDHIIFAIHRNDLADS
ncbi:GNAT family protein [Vibrio sp. SCSIO 43136]|uniref:GNAT family N-acetyltransferase n=1 Tax=Vibrio sp. SCSIO 43136 TaxID=2819101 RepID=UPI0020763D53|nr:GNAT family protein [Vibrio sp. SCSIO 43136]USD64023.1 GNAT family N-acetyltransferase [Vibrio sp. SCSIO 43136]